MGTGLGPESYAIIEQGRIGQILSSTPAGSPCGHRGSGRHHQIQDQAPAGRGQAGERQTEPGPCVRHPGRGHAAGKLAQAAGREGAPLRRTQDGDGRPAADAAFGQIPPAGARHGEGALDLNVASGELKRADGAGWCQGRGAQPPAGRLLPGGAVPDRGASPGGGTERGSRAHTRPAGRPSEAECRHRAADPAAEKESQELDGRLTGLEGEITGHRGSLDELDRQIAGARDRMQEKNQQREAAAGKISRAGEGHRKQPAR